MTDFNDSKDVKLTPGFAYVEVYGAYNETPDGKPLINRKGFPMLSVTLAVVDMDGNVGRKKLYVSANWESQVINIENAFGIENLFDTTRNTFNYEAMLRKSAGAVLVPDEKYGTNFEMFVPLSWFDHAARRNDPNYNMGRPKVLTDTYTGVRGADAKRLVEKSEVELDDDIPF